MRGQGFNRSEEAITPPVVASPNTTPAATTTAAWTYPTGDFPTVYTAFTAQVQQRYGVSMSQSAIEADAWAQGFTCAPDNQGQQVCERLQPIVGGCEDVFVVTARAAGGAQGDVRRRCPIGQDQREPLQPGPSNLLGAPIR